MATSRGSLVVVGAGIVGLATARRYLEVRPGSEVTVVDKEHHVAVHQTGHNSGVVHAGIYYAPGSLKAALCRRGGELLRAYCNDRHLPYEAYGKLVVARTPDELPRLRALEQRARANRVPDLALLEPPAMADLEPHVAGVAALHSPHTAAVDYGRVAETLAREVEDRGGRLLLATEVTGFATDHAGLKVVTSAGDLATDRAVTCAGLHADRLARLAGDGPDPAIVPFRGDYYRLAADRADLVRGLVYPVPDPRYPFLGVHLTRRVSGGVDVGPNAVLALGREAYRRSSVDRHDLAELLAWPGLRRLAWHHWPAGVREVASSVSKLVFLAAARSYVPDLRLRDLVPAPSGIRAQAVDRAGRLVDDFVVHDLGPVLAVRNAPSPAATSSLAIAEHLVDRLVGAPA